MAPPASIQLTSIARGFVPFVALMATLALLACSKRTQPGDHLENIEFATLTGERLSLHSDAPTLVSFWSTTCPICVSEIPDLAALEADLAPGGFRLVAVAMPYDRPDHVLQLAEARAITYPVALDIDGKVLAAFEPVPGTPTHFLVDGRGKVLEKRLGRLDTDAIKRVVEKLI